MGGNFTVTQRVSLLQKEGTPIIFLNDAHTTKDELTGVPIV
jgi:hypothetical protein